MFVVSILHLFVCALLIVIVLLQQGRGADAGVTFGGGGGTVFGAAGADTLLTKVTTILAICFMVTSVILSATQNKWAATEGNLFKNVKDEQPAAAPATTPAPDAKDAAPVAQPAQETAPTPATENKSDSTAAPAPQ